MKILLVTSVDPWTRSVSTIHHFVATGRRLGHEVHVYGKPNPELPRLSWTTNLDGVDLALFIVQVTTDFPDMPYLARLLDNIPRERRVVIDLWGRFNDTIRLDHDFNHLEKLEGHLGWEWEEASKAVSDTILQPTLAPLRPNVRSFLFHGFEPQAVVRGDDTAATAAARWRDAGPELKPYGVVYVGSNWQRWEQVRAFLEAAAPMAGRVGPTYLLGWDWAKRPEWAVKSGIMGVDTDPGLLEKLDVHVCSGVRFDQIVDLLGQARFAPVFHRPLFKKLGFVTNRSFETFYADSLPILMLPRDFVAAIYGDAALTLVPDGDVAAHLSDALNRPDVYWEAVLKTRAHLAANHSYAHRFQELLRLTKGSEATGAAH